MVDKKLIIFPLCLFYTFKLWGLDYFTVADSIREKAEFIFLKENHFQESAEACIKAKQIIPDTSTVIYQYIDLLLQANWSEGQKAFQIPEHFQSITADIELGWKAQGLAGLLYYRQSGPMLEQAYIQLTSAIQTAPENKDSAFVAYFRRILGRVQLALGNHAEAISLFLASNQYYRATPFQKSIHVNERFIGRAYSLQNIDSLAYVYYLRSAAGLQQWYDQHELAYAYNSLADQCIRADQLETAEAYQDSCCQLAIENGYTSLLALSVNNFGELAMLRNNYIKAIEHFDHAIKLYRNMQNSRALTETLYNRANTFFGMHKVALSIRDLYNAEEIALANSRHEQLSRIYLLLSELYETIGKQVQAYNYYKAYSEQKDLLNKATELEKIAMHQIKFKVHEKEKRIQHLKYEALLNETELTRKNTIVWFTFILLILVVVVFVFFIRAIKRRQTLLAVNSKLQGLEEERKRLAGELHDGIASHLFAIELSLSNDAFVPCGSIQKQIASIRDEVRSMSHDLDALNFTTSNLFDAFSLVIKRNTEPDNLAVYFDQTPDPFPWQTIDMSIQKQLYRILQELLQNTQKYASAHSVEIQITFIDNTLEILYCDDGKGFDTSAKHGFGLQNIQDRIASMRGTLEIETAPTKGMSAFICLPQQ